MKREVGSCVQEESMFSYLATHPRNKCPRHKNKQYNKTHTDQCAFMNIVIYSRYLHTKKSCQNPKHFKKLKELCICGFIHHVKYFVFKNFWIKNLSLRVDSFCTCESFIHLKNKNIYTVYVYVKPFVNETWAKKDTYIIEIHQREKDDDKLGQSGRWFTGWTTTLKPTSLSHL